MSTTHGGHREVELDLEVLPGHALVADEKPLTFGDTGALAADDEPAADGHEDFVGARSEGLR